MIDRFFTSYYLTQNRDSDRDTIETVRGKYASVSLSQTLVRETARQWLVIVIQQGIEGVSDKFKSRHLKIETATETQSRQFTRLKGVTEYSERLLRLCTPSAKKSQEEVSLPIPSGFDLPDREQIYRAAYDLWQPVRDKMPAWIKYMSLRKAHQSGDKSLAQAHKDAEQAYYVACQQCPEFQYYTQVRQKLFPAPKAIDWEAQDHKRSA